MCVLSKRSLQKSIPLGACFSVVSFICRHIKHVSSSDHPGVQRDVLSLLLRIRVMLLLLFWAAAQKLAISVLLA